MNRFVLLIFLSLYFVEIYTQEYSDNHNINIKYNKEAKYPDGDFQLVKDILSKMEYTKEAIEALVDDKIMVSFYVNTDSTVSDVSIIKGLNYGINDLTFT